VTTLVIVWFPAADHALVVIAVDPIALDSLLTRLVFLALAALIGMPVVLLPGPTLIMLLAHGRSLRVMSRKFRLPHAVATISI
jgi:hypothetical protein